MVLKADMNQSSEGESGRILHLCFKIFASKIRIASKIENYQNTQIVRSYPLKTQNSFKQYIEFTL